MNKCIKKFLLAISAVVMFAGFQACEQIEPTSLSGDSLPQKVTVTGHARYIAYDKDGLAEDPVIVDAGTVVNVFYGVPDGSGNVDYACKSIVTDSEGYFETQIGCPVGQVLEVKTQCSILGSSYAMDLTDGDFVSTDTYFYGEVKKSLPCGKAGYFVLDMMPAANISDKDLDQPK